MLEVIGYMTIGVVFALILPILKAWAESKDTWVELTDDEIHACSDTPWTPTGMKCIRAILAKCKENNT